MQIDIAWTTLGFDYSEVFSGFLNTPRSQRVGAVLNKFEEAKKTARQLLALHHPDKGGDPIKFKRVNEAIQSIEEETQDFVKKMSTSDVKENHSIIKFNL